MESVLKHRRRGSSKDIDLAAAADTVPKWSDPPAENESDGVSSLSRFDTVEEDKAGERESYIHKTVSLEQSSPIHTPLPVFLPFVPFLPLGERLEADEKQYV